MEEKDFSETEYREVLDKKGFKFMFNKFVETLEKELNDYERKNPQWIEITFLQIIKGSIESLRSYIEDPGEEEINWESPFVELQYPVKMDWEDLSPYYFEITEKDIQDFDKTIELITEGFFNIKQAHILRELTNDIALLKKRDYYTVLLTEEVRKKVNRLAKSRREARIKKLSQKKFTFPLPGVVIDKKGKERKAKGTLIVQFNALIIDKKNKEAYYPILTGFEFKGYSPSLWTEEVKRDFWNTWLQSLKKVTPEEDLDLELQPLPEPRVKAITPKQDFVKAGLHLELQKFGKSPKVSQASLFDTSEKDTQKEIEKHKIEVVGIDNTQAQNQALFAIQKLLNKTNYKGNLPSTILDGENAFKMKGELPVFRFTQAQYLEAYGVKKYRSKRGKWEYSGEGRRQALQALADLRDKKNLIYYERKYRVKNKKGKSEERFDVIKTVRPLIKIAEGYEDLTRPERDTVISGKSSKKTDPKLKFIAIEPCPIFIDQLETFFVLKPANCYQEINLLFPRSSKYVYQFIDYLITQAGFRIQKKKKMTLKINYRELAYKLRMDSYIKNRKWRTIKKALHKCYKTAKELGYISEYKTIQGVTKELEEFTLNPEKFKRVEEIEREREQIETTISPKLPH